MISERNTTLFGILIVTVLLAVQIGGDQTNAAGDLGTYSQGFDGPDARGVFSPRFDYNEWTPVGRGDPLKNDPTYDYSPPVLDRVRYWADNANTDNSNYNEKKDKGDILLLGVPAKRSQSLQKEFNSIRRSFYTHPLPTHLMPPPMQTLAPSTGKPATETYSFYQPSKTHYPSPHWTASNMHHGDNHYDESVNYVSITRPSTRPNINEIQTSALARKPWVHELLKKELVIPKASIPTRHVMMEPLISSTTYAPPTQPTTTMITPIYITSTTPEPIPTTIESEEFVPTTTSPSVETTTDSLFSHYKQPLQSLHGPMYLIIEGHSKVKTYGLKDVDNQIHMPKIVPVAPTQQAVRQHVVLSDAEGLALNVKHLHTRTLATPSPTSALLENSLDLDRSKSEYQEPSTMDNLLSLLDSSLGNFFLNDIPNEGNTTNNGPMDMMPSLVTPTPITFTTTTADSSRDKRQIFDYDQLPESRLKEVQSSEDDDDTFQKSSPQSKVIFRSSMAKVSAEESDEIS